MLIMRDAQIQALQQHWAGQWIDRLCAHVHRWFPLVGASLPAAALHAQVTQVLERAQALHGFTSQRDTMRYINLSAVHGWNFEDRPECAWMREYLRDPDVSSVSARLERVVQRDLADQAIAAHNQLQRAANLHSVEPVGLLEAWQGRGELELLAQKASQESHG